MAYITGDRLSRVAAFDWYDGAIEGVVAESNAYRYFWLVGDPNWEPRTFAISIELPQQMVSTLVDALKNVGVQLANSASWPNWEHLHGADRQVIDDAIRMLRHHTKDIHAIVRAVDIDAPIERLYQPTGTAELAKLRSLLIGNRFHDVWAQIGGGETG